MNAIVDQEDRTQAMEQVQLFCGTKRRRHCRIKRRGMRLGTRVRGVRKVRDIKSAF